MMHETVLFNVIINICYLNYRFRNWQLNIFFSSFYLQKGVIYPGLHCLVSKWAPPEEKGKFISALLGGLLGTVVTWSTLGVIIENFGWKFGFYVPAVIAIFNTVLWYTLTADSPEQHSRITKKELEFIRKSLGDTISKEKRLPPLKSVLTSVPFFALLILHYGSLWGL